MKIVEYKLLYNCYYYLLVDQINEEIRTGWQPFGNLIRESSLHDNNRWYQAMVKYEDQWKISDALLEKMYK